MCAAKAGIQLLDGDRGLSPRGGWDARLPYGLRLPLLLHALRALPLLCSAAGSEPWSLLRPTIATVSLRMALVLALLALQNKMMIQDTDRDKEMSLKLPQTDKHIVPALGPSL